jgi:hypothetical protein
MNVLNIYSHLQNEGFNSEDKKTALK